MGRRVWGGHRIQNDDGTKYVNIQNVGKPLQVIKHDSFSPTSKLDLVLALLRHGWVALASPEPFKPDAPKHFTSSRTRPTSYFYCLVTHAALFANGVGCIPHDVKDLYYQCLLGLRGSALGGRPLGPSWFWIGSASRSSGSTSTW